MTMEAIAPQAMTVWAMTIWARTTSVVVVSASYLGRNYFGYVREYHADQLRCQVQMTVQSSRP